MYQALVQHFESHHPEHPLTAHLKESPPENISLPIGAVWAWGKTPLKCALLLGDYDAVLLMVRAGVDPNSSDNIHRSETRSLLSAIVGSGRIDLARELVALGADVNHSTAGAIPPLVKACYLDNPRDMVEALLALGADPNLERDSGPLDAACEYHDFDTPLSVSIQGRDLALVDSLIINGGADPHRLTARHLAHADPECLRRLLQVYCVAPDAGEGLGETPLAILYTFVSMVDVPSRRASIQVLLEAGADRALALVPE